MTIQQEQTFQWDKIQELADIFFAKKGRFPSQILVGSAVWAIIATRRAQMMVTQDFNVIDNAALGPNDIELMPRNSPGETWTTSNRRLGRREGRERTSQTTR